MQFFGILSLVAGYACLYTASQMLKRPPGGSSGNVLYWMTGIDALGAPSGNQSANVAGAMGGRNKQAGAVAKNINATHRGTHG